MKDRNEAQTKTFEALYSGKPGSSMAKTCEIDMAEIELRTLAKLRQDAENTDEFNRDSDPSGVDTQKLRTLLSLKDARDILDGGVVKPADFHKNKAAELFACKPEDVTEAQRQFAKTYYFGELYGNPQSFIGFLESRGLPPPIDEGS